MSRYGRWGVVVALLPVVGYWGGSNAPGQSGSGMRPQPGSTTQAQPRPQAPEEFRRSFWAFLTHPNTGYRRWAAWPGTEQGKPSQAPHGAFVRIYANPAAQANRQALPHGTVLVKENYGDDRQTLAAITVMYRAQGFDPQNGDWYWIKYLPDGSVDAMDTPQGRMAVAGRVSMCIQCHSGANGNDFTFSND